VIVIDTPVALLATGRAGADHTEFHVSARPDLPSSQLPCQGYPQLDAGFLVHQMQVDALIGG